MNFYRAVTGKASAWAAAESLCVGDDFPFDLIGELADGRSSGLSTFVAVSPAEERLASIAASLWLNTSQQERSYSFRMIEESFVLGLGLGITKTTAGLSVSRLNSFHYDLTGLKGPSSIALLKHMVSADPIEIPALRVLQEVASFIARQEITFADIKPEGLKALVKKNLLRAA